MFPIHRRAVLALVLTALWLSGARTVQGWGFEAHYFILDRAIDLMPEPIRPFFQKHRAYIVSHTIDPDLWRSVGWEEEPPRHFINLDSYEKFPFEELPRGYGAAIQKYGLDALQQKGVLPWRAAEMYGRLVRAFQDVARERSFARESVQLFTAVLAHYVADAHVPLHSAANHDGQLTNQDGLHARWETDLFLRYRDKLTIAPAPPKPVKEPRDAMFAIVLESYTLVAPLLEADKQAASGREIYDDGYYQALFSAMKPMLERRLSESISAIASFVAGAWEAAGRPALPLEQTRVPRKVPRGRP
jgi:hypothetical protein